MRSNCSGHEVVTHLSPEKEEENRSTEIATEIAPTEIATWAQSAQQQLLPPKDAARKLDQYIRNNGIRATEIRVKNQTFHPIF